MATRLLRQCYIQQEKEIYIYFKLADLKKNHQYKTRT